MEEEKINLLLVQWQTCVEMANSVSQRRDTINNIFVTLNVSIITANSFLTNDIKILFPFLGILICIIWILMINHFKNLNKAKFEVINKIENEFFFKPFNEEWKILNENKKYKDGTKIESFLSKIFIGIYIMIVIIMIYLKNGGLR